jgi:dolichyl-phosphate beta-glucosyltransferase
MTETYLPPHLSIVIPAYNEAQRLPKTLATIDAYLQEQPFRGEIVVVDDGSQDATLEIARKFAEGRPARVLSPGHQGKGGAVRAGMLAAEGEWVLMTDADLCTPLEDAGALLAAAQEGFDVAIGSRALPDSMLQIRQPFYREWMGRVGNKIIQAVLLPGIRDTQCGFKLFRREAAREIFSRSLMNGWSFDIEALYLARRLGYRICEAPVHWSHRAGSKLRIGRDYLGTLRDLFVIRDLHKGVRPLSRSASTDSAKTSRRI